MIVVGSDWVRKKLYTVMRDRNKQRVKEGLQERREHRRVHTSGRHKRRQEAARAQHWRLSPRHDMNRWNWNGQDGDVKMRLVE